MAGAINFAMSDIYGGIWGTTETTIPEANDQQALVDDQKAAEAVSDSGKKQFPIAIAIVLILAVAIVAGAVKL